MRARSFQRARSPALSPVRSTRGFTLIPVILVVIIIILIFVIVVVLSRPKIVAMVNPICDEACQRVKSVEIVPALTYSQPGTDFEIHAIPRDEFGAVVANAPAASWTGSVTFKPDVHSAIITAPQHTARDIRATIGNAESEAAVVLVEREATWEPNIDLLQVAHQTEAPVSAALVDAWFSGITDCEQGNDLFFPMAASALLGRNLGTSAGCTNRLAIFSPTGALYYEVGTAWNTLENTMSPSVPTSPLPVQIATWFRTSDTDPVGVADADLNYATDIYLTERAGMTFARVDGDAGASGIVRTYDGDGQCNNFDDLTVTPNDALINVVYVEAVVAYGDAVRGMACKRPAPLSPIILLSRELALPSTLAHEIAHLMGLSKPPFTDWRGGHTLYLPDFDETNLMWPRGYAGGSERDQLSLGQVFRLHIDVRSWVNQSVNGVSIRTGLTEDCQADRHTRTPCPELHLDIGGS